jgi:hypothetical protein
MKYTEGQELCRMAIAKADEESSDWVNTVIGFYYKFNQKYNPRCNCYTADTIERLESGRFTALAIIESLLAGFVNDGNMPETDIDLPFGFTKKAREAMAERAKEMFKKIDEQ